MRLLFVQYAGDYREAVERFGKGGEETYYAQKNSVDTVADIAKRIEEAAVLCCITPQPYNEVVENGVRAIGGGFDTNIPTKKLIQLIEKQKPTHLILTTPIKEVLGWAIQNKIETIALLADSFPEGLRHKIRNHQLIKFLNNQQIRWVLNHGLNAPVSLQKIGVNPDKIIPWDWSSVITPDAFSPKTLRQDAKTWQLLYVGSLVESKGVGDVIEAIAKLRAKNLPVTLKIAGKGETEYFIERVKQLGLEEAVEFLGVVAHRSVIQLMREADLVVIPSRPDYPEGFPMTIYEALCSRTPIVASDHPMFQNKLRSGINAMIFPAGNSEALVDSINTLFSSPELYQRLSLASAEAWQQLQIPVKWSEAINRWLGDTPEDRQWLFEHRLSSGRYIL